MKTVWPLGRIERLPGRGADDGLGRGLGWVQLRAQWPGMPQLKQAPCEGGPGMEAAGRVGGFVAWGAWGGGQGKPGVEGAGGTTGTGGAWDRLNAEG